ncbi:MAG: hypothetical protein QG583_517 [Patescibacteria group bacterium]|nr:hypothetical protein [Patescibacteria group bacterium]MDQ5971642.1 hypothetical protein [Patescibacteria group bacterium]
MKIIDTNILNKFVKGEIILDLSNGFYITDDLKNEIDNLKSISSEYKRQAERITFIDIKNHPHFNEAKYLENYKQSINKYNSIVSFYGLKGLGDISIIAMISTIINHPNPTLFEGNDIIEIITHDGPLKDVLGEKFGKKIIINDPM